RSMAAYLASFNVPEGPDPEARVARALAPTSPKTDLQHQGEAIYVQHCASCHGAPGHPPTVARSPLGLSSLLWNRYRPYNLLRVLFLAVGLAAVSFNASGQTMEFGCPKPGTTFAFDAGSSMTARSQEGMDCTMQFVGGQSFKVRALLFANPAPDGSDISAFL